MTTKIGILVAFISALLAAQVLGAGTPPATTRPAPAPAPREAIVVYYDHTEPAITFSARELQKTLRALGHNPATLKPLAELPASPEPCYVVLAQHTSLPVLTLLRDRGGQSSGAVREQAYALRNTRNNGKRGYWVIGGDRIGAMYGGIHLGEIAAAGAITDLADGDHTPYIARRGIKFNIPLDKRQPSFDDNGTSGLENARKGAHTFRHTLATDLLRKGASLEEIGRVLRHKSPDTTTIYAKVEIEALRQLALPWAGGGR
jgi:hypothetical protein